MSSSVWFGWAVVASIILLLLTAPAVLIWTGHLQTGFGNFTSPTGEFQRAKTLWDWMDLLLAPAVLGAFGALFSWMLGRGQRAADERRAEIEQDRANEAALQKYLDSMMDLLKEGFNGPEVTDINRSIARARTLTVLRQLRHVNGERKGLLLTFLIE